MRVVLDTNILIDALITKGTPPDSLYQAWLRGTIGLVTSTTQVGQLADVLARRRLRKFLDPDEAKSIVENINTRALILDALPSVFLSPGPMDNHILATAIPGDVELIVSGDKRDMLAAGEIENIPIVTAREALERLRNA